MLASLNQPWIQLSSPTERRNAFVNNYDVVNVMTGGGPYHSTEVGLTYIMNTAFQLNNMGKANAMSMILVLFVAIFGFLQLKTMTREENYE